MLTFFLLELVGLGYPCPHGDHLGVLCYHLFIIFRDLMPDCKPQLRGWEISLLEVDYPDDHATHSLIKCVQ